MQNFLHLKSITNLSKIFGDDFILKHPLIAVIDFSKVYEHTNEIKNVTTDFYSIIFKKYKKDNLKYGRKSLDFNDGNLICISPNQVVEIDSQTIDNNVVEGWGLFFHPDLIRNYPLIYKINEHSFFTYQVSESLHLSEKEKQIFIDCILKIDLELKENIDSHTQNIIVATIELLLNYCSRFYSRQFITRNSSNHYLVKKIEKILSDYFDRNNNTIPTVKYLAEQVNLSSGYLGDLLKRETGKNAQEHIHLLMIEKAKSILWNSEKSISEIAFQLGFEHPSHFSKLFKSKVGLTPKDYRRLN